MVCSINFSFEDIKVNLETYKKIFKTNSSSQDGSQLINDTRLDVKIFHRVKCTETFEPDYEVCIKKTI